MKRHPHLRATTHINLRAHQPKPPANPPTSSVYRRVLISRSESAPRGSYKCPNPSIGALQKIPFLNTMTTAKCSENYEPFSQTCHSRKQLPLLSRIHKIAQIETHQREFELESMKEELQFMELVKALNII
jgi:hypothetical protein